MSASFLHGVETVEYTKGPTQIQTVATAVIGLVGTAPIHTLADATKKTIHQPVIIANDRDAVTYFGQESTGFTIPSALKRIFQQGSGPVLVINVFDPALHKTGETPDVAKVTATDIMGGVTAGGVRTGMQAFLDCQPTLGFGPRQLIAPGWCSATGVMSAMDILAGKLRAIAWIDAPAGLTPQQAITARGVGGALNTSSNRLGLLYPYAKLLGPGAQLTIEPLSALVAGAQAAKDNAKGYWHSVSNTELKGVLGLERPIQADLKDPNCEANLLNAAGFITVYNDFGTGFRVWGNRSAAFPTASAVDSFLCVRRTADIIEDSIEAASLRYMDRPITQALIDQIVGDINQFLRGLQGKGAVLEGSKAWFDPSLNPPTEMAAGHLTLSYRFLPPSPLERLSFESWLDITLYSGVA